MLSEKQQIANRQNALKSTGPRTAAGRHTASQNAFKHGLRSSLHVSGGRDTARYEQFRRDLHAQLAPVGLIESRLADQAASDLWKMQCLDRLEPELLRTLHDRYSDSQQADEEPAMTLSQRMYEFKRAFYADIKTCPDSAFRTRFDTILCRWLNTSEGMAFKEGRWPMLPWSQSYMDCFKEFWTEYSGQPLTPEPTAPQQSSSVAADPQVSQEKRTDLSYQVMMESRTAGDAASCTAAASVRNVISAEQSNSGAPGTLEESDRTADTHSSIENQQSDNVGLAPAMIEDFAGSNVLLKFSRYQTQAQRSLYRVLNELNKLQFLRKRNESIFSPNSEP